MAEYYYTNNPTSEHEERHFTSVFMGRTLAFETDAGVFSKQHIDPGSEILCKSLPELHGRVLDMGCGWGAMTVMTLARFPALDVTMADVNERALDLAVRNVQKNGMRAKAVLSDGFERVEGEFDAVMTNPPIRAGKAVIYGMFLFESDRKLWQIVLARAAIMVFVNIMLNTVFLIMLYGPSQAALLPVRIMKNVMQFPIDCLLLTAVCRTVQRIPTAAAAR